MTTFVFPGQGSQRKGMGAGLFEKFGDLTAQADELLGYSISELCLRDEQAQLTQTEYTQPALYVVNALSYLNLVEEKGLKPDFLAGHSLGEYNALFAAGAFDFETGLRLVKKRGELMSQISDGGMAAVVGLGEDRIRRILEESNLEGIDVANFNAPDQIIVSGLKGAIVMAKPIFEAAGARCALLPVSGAFHSRHILPAQRDFTKFLHQFDYAELRIPVVSNVEAKLYTKERLIELLSLQLTHSVRWMESIQFLLRQGQTEFTEVGPGNVLTRLIEKIRQEPIPAEASKSEKVVVQASRQAQDFRPASPTNIPVQVPTRPGSSNGNRPAQHPGTISDRTIASTLAPRGITAATFGDEEFKRDYGIKYAYVAGGINRGISSTEYVLRMARAGLLGFFGTGGLELSQIEAGIRDIQRELKDGQVCGASLVCNTNDPQAEEATVDLLLKYGVGCVEAVSYIQITPALVRYRLQGLSQQADGTVVSRNKVLAKLTRPEVAEAFLSPAPERIVEKLLRENKITRQEAALAARVPLADDLCVEADSGWHTDQGAAHVLLPIILKLRDEAAEKFGYARKVRVGSAEGIGTPYAVATAFILGADFVMTGTLNQCSVEADLSAAAKDLLEQMNVQDTEYAPAREMFELGAKVRVLKKGLLFPARANKLYDLYRQFDSLEEIDEKTSRQVQERYFKKSFTEVYATIKSATGNRSAQQVEEAERNPKQKMALVFKWYLEDSQNLALNGDDERRVDYQIQCEPALGAFNHWTKGTSLEKWRNRHVDEIADRLMVGAAEFSNHRFQSLVAQV